MPIIKWEPIKHLDPLREIENLFNDNMLSRNMATLSDLAMNVYEENGKIVAEMNIPGIDAEKVDISIQDNVLTVSGSREEIKEKKAKTYYHQEIHSGSFQRSVRLPVSVVSEKAQAEYADGILRITMPKESEKKGKIKVKVKK